MENPSGSAAASVHPDLRQAIAIAIVKARKGGSAAAAAAVAEAKRWEDKAAGLQRDLRRLQSCTLTLASLLKKSTQGNQSVTSMIDKLIGGLPAASTARTDASPTQLDNDEAGEDGSGSLPSELGVGSYFAQQGAYQQLQLQARSLADGSDYGCSMTLCFLMLMPPSYLGDRLRPAARRHHTLSKH